MKKRIVSILICLLMCLNCFNIVFAAPPILSNNGGTSSTEKACSSIKDGQGGLAFDENGNIVICTPTQAGQDAEDVSNDTYGIIFFILKALRVISIMLCVISLVYGALQLASSVGNNSKKAKA